MQHALPCRDSLGASFPAEQGKVKDILFCTISVLHLPWGQLLFLQGPVHVSCSQYFLQKYSSKGVGKLQMGGE